MILSLLFLPVKIFRALMTFFQLLWAVLLIAIIVLIIVYWDLIKSKVNYIIDGIKDIINIVSNLQTYINTISAQINDINNVINPPSSN